MSYFRSGDPLDDFDRLDRAQAEWEARLPQCEKCGKPIQDDIYFEIDNDILCEDCVRALYAKFTADY